MYFPYMRAKQNELLAIRELGNLIHNNGHIVPIIEPVKELGRTYNSLLRTLEGYETNNTPFILIFNPTVGEFKHNNQKIILEVIPSLRGMENSHILGCIISNNTTQQDVQQFLNIAQTDQICFIHACDFANPSLLMGYPNLKYQIFFDQSASITYQSNFSSADKVIIKDGFTQQIRNADYPTSENFFDLTLTYHSNYIGFGDFLIVGKPYTDDGGPAHAVALHLTYIKSTGDIGIKHYISDRTTTNQDTPGKYFEALQKLITDKNSNPLILNTTGLDEFQQSYNESHFPGLGSVKKFSMKHHIELMASIV